MIAQFKFSSNKNVQQHVDTKTPASRAPPRGNGGQRYHFGDDPKYRRSCRHVNKSMEILEDDVEQNEEKKDSLKELNSSDNKIEENEEQSTQSNVFAVTEIHRQSLSHRCRSIPSSDWLVSTELLTV
ncbi:hypothetical protein ILUMI_03609 [Ignelater luminosus]|uniref:Uncharacterized protein n=1 Tax=Ignelater luminosus TaxID=2038154 RepID=A0A8K0DLF9_IGNLU|nr:hypothetical protein ILUMI_03609 [Ignelater luminosus]